MENIIYYMMLITYPCAIFLFVIGSLLAFKATKRRSALSLLIGFVLVLTGYFLQNYGPTDIIHTEAGDAVINYTILFSLGSLLGQIGILISAISFVLYARHKSAT